MFKSWKSRVGVLALTAMLVGVPTVGLAGPAGGAGADKFDLLGPRGLAVCPGGVVHGAPGGFGFANINAPSNGTVATTVSLKGLSPNMIYNVELIQGLADCFSIDATITTNGNGNGTVHWSEPSVSTHALVAVQSSDFVESYVTETYNH